MKVEQIRSTYLEFFEERDHLRVPSASLVPSANDPSVLLTTAGMQPFKPYFLGQEEPPSRRITDVQRCFRTTDIGEVGKTARHLTLFEMLGNWSFGDYFKEESIPWGWELSTKGFGMDPETIWVTVFGGDEELALGPDTEAIEIWEATGVPDERIVQLPRSENFWQGGPTGPCGPCSELYVDRGESFGSPGDKPGDDTERFLEFWNHVFMSYDLSADGQLSPLPMRNIDTGMGVERMAAILQDVESVYDTDALRPLIDLAEELSGRKYDADEQTTRAMRIIADHSRGTAALIADGVVPSNEERGYVLRRVMRRAIQQGRSIGLEGDFMEKFADLSLDLLAPAFPELAAERETVKRWVNDEQHSFGRTLERGSELLDKLVAQTKADGATEVDAAEAFQLHDTYGFPFELTRELLAEAGLSVDEAGFDALMTEQRDRARSVAVGAHGGEDRRAAASDFASAAEPSRFVGYETLNAETSLVALDSSDGVALAKLEESPFYPEGGGQVADSGVLRWDGGEARITDVFRVGDDQVLALELDKGTPQAGERVEAEVERTTRHATMANHTATHLLHAALRELLGDHVRQAGSAVRPDKLRFDFNHGAALSPEEIAALEDAVNDWIKAARPVRAMQMEKPEAERLGAMALFGEKYGDWVRVIEVDGVSRELCGGTHVANTSEIGIFRIISEGSSAANVRRIEALTGPEAIDDLRARADQLDQVGELLGFSGDPVAAAGKTAERIKGFEAGERESKKSAAAEAGDQLQATDVAGLQVLVGQVDGADQNALLDLADRLKAREGEAAVVLGGADGNKVALVASFSPGAIERGLSAKGVISEAAPIVGGGGGGRDDVARAGGKDPDKLEAALDAARAAIASVLESS